VEVNGVLLEQVRPHDHAHVSESEEISSPHRMHQTARGYCRFITRYPRFGVDPRGHRGKGGANTSAMASKSESAPTAPFQVKFAFERGINGNPAQLPADRYRLCRITGQKTVGATD